MSSITKDLAPGTPGARLQYVIATLAKWFPEAYNEFAAEPPEVKLLAALAKVMTPSAAQAGQVPQDEASADLRQTILNTVSDLVSNFTYYDRKGDEDLSSDDLEEAVKQGVITVDEIVAQFHGRLLSCMVPEEQQVKAVVAERIRFEAFYRKKLGMPADLPFQWSADWARAAWEGWLDRSGLSGSKDSVHG
jgi:hypothetical protein